MTALVFVDTNVLVYSRDAGEAEKQPRADAWRRALWRARAGCLSVQVLTEYYVTVTRKLSPGMSRELARAEIRDLAHWRLVPTTTELVESAWELEERHRVAWWDALVLAAAIAAGCAHLLSEDFQPGQDFGGITVVSPFATSPEAILKAK